MEDENALRIYLGYAFRTALMRVNHSANHYSSSVENVCQVRGAPFGIANCARESASLRAVVDLTMLIVRKKGREE
jgi:hypothetical protein